MGARLRELEELVALHGNLREVLRVSRPLMHSLLAVERINLFATDPRNTMLWTLARSGGERPIRLPRSHACLVGYAAIVRRAIVVRDAYDAVELRTLHPDLRHDEARDAGLGSRTRRVLAAPLFGERAVVGALELINPLDNQEFGRTQVAVAEEVARILAPLVEVTTSPQDGLRPEAARFGMLIARGLLTSAKLEDCIALARAADGDVPAMLQQHAGVPRDAIGEALADWHHVPFFAYDGAFRMSRALRDRVPIKFLQQQVCAPLALQPDGTLLFAFESPDKLELIDAVRARRLAPRIEPVVALRRELLAYLDASVRSPASSGVFFEPPLLDPRHDGSLSARPAGDELLARLVAALGRRVPSAPDPIETADDGPAGDTDDAIVGRLVRQLILEASARGASDLHIEPNSDQGPCRVRLRIDGDCVDFVAIPGPHRQPVVQRIKILSELDISERRRPQDGRLRVLGPQGPIEVRVATLPTVGDNEDVVLRLLSAFKPTPLDELALSPANLTVFRDMISQPYGIVLVVGPTGSGKTTTLHAALAALNTQDMKIVTVEDPVEIVQPGLRQVQVNARIGLGFPEALRSFLRADPDVIMVGEMRDRITVAVGIEASLTGHLVLSTLQANSAPETLTRLIGMDVDVMGLADALRGVLAQRLVRKLCGACKLPHVPSDAEWDSLGESARDAVRRALADERGDVLGVRRAVGCVECRGTGYRGRLALHELMPGSPAVQGLIRRRASLDDLRRAVAREGVKTMLEDGVEKVLLGLTDLRQVRSACVV